MTKLMTKDNGIMLGVGVLAFIGVRYLLNKQNENTSSAEGQTAGRVCGSEISVNDLDSDWGGDLRAWSKCVCYGKGCKGGYSQTSNGFMTARQRPTINIPKKGGFVARRRAPSTRRRAW